MNKEQAREIIQKYYLEHSKEIKTNKRINEFLSQEKELDLFLNDYLKYNSWFETKENLFRCFYYDVFVPLVCKSCGKEMSVDEAKKGKKYCSFKCGISNEAQEKRKQTCLEKYGYSTPLLNQDCKEKSKKTCLEKFGQETFVGSEEYKSKVSSPFKLKKVQEKSKETKIKRYGENFGKEIFKSYKNKVIEQNLEKYGVPFLLMDKEIQNKTFDTMERKYGARSFWKSIFMQKEKFHKFYQKLSNWSEYVIPLFSEEEYEGQNKEYRWKCTKCGNEFYHKIYTTGIGNNRTIPRCEVCFPNQASSFMEKEVLEFVKSIYSGKIQNNIRILNNKRKELDIYLPEKKIGIEFDGIYWHNSENKSKDYHLEKTLLCEEKEIQLIHIFENEWCFKRKIVEDRLKSLLGIYDKKIYARKCEIKEIDRKVCNNFLNENHLQGSDNSSIRYGLFFENELVSVMTFGKPRFNKKYDFELIRFSSKLGYQIIGGSSKLLRYFIRKHLNSSIISYADRKYSKGKMYESLGFKLVGSSNPNYFWVKGNIVLSRYQCQKHKLSKILGDKFDVNLSETENMILNGFYKIYDCGNLVYEYNPLLSK